MVTEKFRKKPAVVEAIQFTEGTPWFVEEIEKWVASNWPLIDFSWEGDSEDDDGYLVLEKPDGSGKMYCYLNDWLVKGVDCSIYPVKNETFKLTYEPVSKDTDKISW